MMDCEDFRDRLDPWLEGHLDAVEQEEAQAHLSACAACRALAEGARRDAEGLDALLTGPGRARLEGMTSRAAQARRTPRWFPWAAAAAVLLPLAVLLRPSHPVPVTAPVASLDRADGPVQWLDAGTWRALSAGAPVPGLGRVRTPEGSRASFRCEDGTLVCLDAGTEAVFHSRRHLEVARGQVWTRVASYDMPMRIDVAAGAVTPLGCILAVAVAPAESRLTTVSGAALFRDLHGGRRTVTTGNACAIRAGRIGELESVPSLDDATAWVGGMLSLPEKKGPEEVENHLRYVESLASRASPEERRKSARVISRLAASRHAGALVGLLSDTDGEVRACAAEALDRLAGAEGPARLAGEEWRRLDGESRDRACDPWQRWWAGRNTKKEGSR